jgi:HEAT repeat protein
MPAAAGLIWAAAAVALAPETAPRVDEPVAVAEAAIPLVALTPADASESASPDAPAAPPAAAVDQPAEPPAARVASVKDADTAKPPTPAPEPAPQAARAEAPAKEEPAKQPAPAAASPPMGPDRKTFAAAVEIKHLDTSTEEELRKQLVSVPELSLDRIPNTTASLKALAQSSGTYAGPASLLSGRSEFQGLQFLQGDECHLGKGPAENLQALSLALRKHVVHCTRKAGSPDVRPDIDMLRDRLTDDDAARRQWCNPDALPALLQLLQAENAPARQLMVDLLAETDDPRATAALAVRAMVDLAPEVRAAAVRALALRPAEDFRDLLVAGLRHPWAPVAAHAAEALAAVRDRGAVAALVGLLDRSPPGLPTEFNGTGQVPVVRELVRVNHLRNCMLCHPPSVKDTDMVRGAIPSPSVPLPSPLSPAYYDNSSTFVHADVTYLRQDFSVMQPVEQPPTGWPTYQRFDYMVRTRKLFGVDARSLAEAKARMTREYRSSVLFALCALTGVTGSGELTDWPAVASAASVPPAPATPPGAVREWKQFLLAEGPADAAARRTDRPSRVAAEMREATTARLVAMSASRLRERLNDDSPDTRAVAARACGLKGDRSLTLDLIFLLDDPDLAVVQEARKALKALTGRDSGPSEVSDRAERRRVTAEWLDWWRTSASRVTKAAN